MEQFWKKWSRDVFPNLVIRQKWHIAHRNVVVGDIVLVHDPNAFRGMWKLGIIRSVVVSSDGKVRKATVGYKNIPKDKDITAYNGVKYTEIERPVQWLVVIQAADETQTE